MGKAARDESRGRGVGEQSRLRLGDPQAGLSHARSGGADPSPLPQRPGAGSTLPGGPGSWRKSRRWGQEARASRGRSSGSHGNLGGCLSSKGGGVSSLSRDGPRAPGKPPRARSRGHKFQVGQEGVNGGPLPVSHSREVGVPSPAHPRAPSRPAVAHARVHAANPAPPRNPCSHARPRRAPRT